MWQQCRRRRGESCVFACDLQCVFHTFLKATLVFVRVLVCFMYVGNCAFVSAYGGLEWGGGGGVIGGRKGGEHGSLTQDV